MLLAEQIVHGIFNDALRRLRIDHVRPLPTRTDGNQRSEILDRIQELTMGIVAFANTSAVPLPPSVPTVVAEEETPVLERISPVVKACLRQEEEKKESVKGEKATTQKTVKKAKRPRDTSDMNRLSANQSQRGAFHVPADIALVLAERPGRLRLSISESADASPGASDQQQQQQKQKQLPSKKYACVQYAPEFIEWLDRASLLIYKSPEMSKAPPIFAANKDEFALLMETSTIKMPADMRCTGCRRYFRIKTEEDNLVQKTMTHFADSTRASHCIRCRVLDWTLSGYNDALHPCRVVIVPVMDSIAATLRNSPDSTTGGSSEGAKKKRIRKKQKPEIDASTAI